MSAGSHSIPDQVDTDRYTQAVPSARTHQPEHDGFVQHLRCTECSGVLHASPEGLACPSCGTRYLRTATGAFDLRLRHPKRCTVEFQIGSDLDRLAAALEFRPLPMNAHPAADFASLPVPQHMSRELMSYFPMAHGPGSLMLDLGCANGAHRLLGEAAGFEWVGVDQNPDCTARVIADGHALPFEDHCFDFALTVAALHLMRHPSVVLQELRRVLRPGATLIGTVAFLEPFHDGGYYHHTHLGVLNSLDNAGFQVHRLAPSEDWNALRAQAQMALFPRMPRMLARSLVAPLDALSRLWWWAGRTINRHPNAAETARVLHTTAAFAFVATARDGAPA